MRTLSERLLTNWHLGRILRTGIGVMMMAMALQSRDWAIGLFGAFFVYQGVMDTGCCGTRTCNAPGTAKKAGIAPPVTVENVEYEEIK